MVSQGLLQFIFIEILILVHTPNLDCLVIAAGYNQIVPKTQFGLYHFQGMPLQNLLEGQPFLTFPYSNRPILTCRYTELIRNIELDITNSRSMPFQQLDLREFRHLPNK